MNLFAPDTDITVKSIALTTDQVEEHQPPPNPTKLTDSRAEGYIERHGMQCWEVDALDPATLQRLIRFELNGIIDRDDMDAVIATEDSDKDRLLLAVRDLDD